MNLKTLASEIFSVTKRLSQVQFQTNKHFTTKQSNIKQKCTSLIYEENGDPVKVLDLMETTLPELKKNQVLVKMLASPVNPADINMVQGVYPIRPELPAIGGNEGVGEVIQVGSKVQGIAVGNRVIPALAGLGTWRTHMICLEDDLISVSVDLSLVHAAMLTVNPCTAYRILKDFTTLEEGDVIIQNAANSAVGKAVIQIASVLNLRTVNVVRNRPDVESLEKSLEALGATHVVTDEFLKSADMKEMMSDLPKPKLGLNAVGGKSGADLIKHMAPGSTLVTYGGMSKQPLLIPAGPLIFNDIRLAGFWMSRWHQENKGTAAQKQMFEWLAELMIKGKFQPPEHDFVPLTEYRSAIEKSMQPYTNRKQVFKMEMAAEQN